MILSFVVYLVQQGAPEGILDRCSYVRIGKDRKPMTEELKNTILDSITKYGTGVYYIIYVIYYFMLYIYNVL